MMFFLIKDTYIFSNDTLTTFHSKFTPLSGNLVQDLKLRISIFNNLNSCSKFSNTTISDKVNPFFLSRSNTVSNVTEQIMKLVLL